MLDFSIFNDLLWSLMSLATVTAIGWNLFRKREVPLEKRVSFLILGMLVSWLGIFAAPIEILFGFHKVWISSIITFIGGLMMIQIMLQWKFGKGVWWKTLVSVVLLALAITGINNLP